MVIKVLLLVLLVATACAHRNRNRTAHHDDLKDIIVMGIRRTRARRLIPWVSD